MPDVIIIGSGVIGYRLAYNLAKPGCNDAVILEKYALGSGTTSKYPGGIRQQSSNEIDARLSMESVKFFEHFEAETSRIAGFRQYAYLMPVANEEEPELFQQNVALQ